MVARATATYRPEVAATVTAMPCGGQHLKEYPLPPEVLAAVPKCHDPSLPRDEQLAALQTAFFAPGNDASVWLDGWWPGSGAGANAMDSAEEWWRGGTVPILVLQPLNDAMMPVAAGTAAAAELGDRATYAEIPDAGHAILPEQPEIVAHHLIEFLRAHPLAGR